ncbi:MAG TPA: hydantoinase B/oxoprolinase family protein [Bryobacteraceae bacterium]|nr:hydantoinase B/oxoprolinase family protein [Bryobacteraceae bacterium]
MTTSRTLDIVTMEVIRNILPAIANEMSYVLQRTSHNMMIYEVRDYCCGLLDTSGRLLSQNTGGVSHFVADLGVVIRDGVERYGREGFQPGDVIITNHQRVGGQHLNNVMVYTPCFEAGRLFGFAVTRAHWMDVGGLSTGFGGGNALDPWMEGLQLDQIKLYEARKIDEKVWQLIRDNIRYPESAMGDLKSQVAACRLAEKRLEEVLTRYGRDIVEQAIERLFDQTEARCRAEVAKFPDGVYEAESLFGGSPLDNDQPVQIRVRVVIAGSDMTIDLTRCSPQRRAPINARTLAAALIAYKAITLPNDPVNEGAFRALKIEIQEGNYMMARYPAAMASWGRTLPTVVDTIFRALAPILPDRMPAAHMGVLGGPIVFFGTDPETGQRFVTQSIEGGGWGGRPWEDGESAAVSVCQGDVHNAPIEKMELRWPILVHRRALRTDSGGPGQFRGGLGLEIEVEGLVDGSWTLTDMGRQQYPAWGVNGGKSGAAADNLLKLPGQGNFAPVNVIRHAVPAGTKAMIATAGGGGWGDPLHRDPESVQRDVLDGYVSIEAARDSYGVILQPETLALDRPETERLRARISSHREHS